MRRCIHACRLIIAFAMICCLVGATPAPEVQFSDITRTSGINFKHENSATSNKYLVETMGGGVAVFDYDKDARLYFFFTTGAKIEAARPEGKLPSKAECTGWNHLWPQNAERRFWDVTEK